MAMSDRIKEYTDFKNFTLKNDLSASNKVSLPASFVSKKIEAIINETREKTIQDMKEFIRKEFEIAKERIDLSQWNNYSNLGEEEVKKRFFEYLDEKLNDSKK